MREWINEWTLTIYLPWSTQFDFSLLKNLKVCFKESYKNSSKMWESKSHDLRKSNKIKMNQVCQQYRLNKNRIQQAFRGEKPAAEQKVASSTGAGRWSGVLGATKYELLSAKREWPCPEVNTNTITGWILGPKNNMGLQRACPLTLRCVPQGVSLKLISRFASHLRSLPVSREPSFKTHLCKNPTSGSVSRDPT